MGEYIHRLLNPMCIAPYELREDCEETYECEYQPTAPINETGRGHQAECRCGNQAQDRETQKVHRVLEVRTPLEPCVQHEIDFAQCQHNNETGQDYSRCRHHTAPYAACCRVAYIRGTIDANRSGCDLAHSHYIHELRLREPAVGFHFVLYQ